MFKKRQFGRGLAMTALAVALMTGTLYAAGEQDGASGNEPASLDADTVEYNVQTGVAIAKGNVLLVQGDLKATGAEAEYNSKTQEGRLEGNVIAVSPSRQIRITADKLTSDAQQHMVATGAPVHGVMEDKTFTGPIVEYFQPENYILIREKGTITSKDGSFTADEMEGFLTEEHLIGRGNVYVNSPPNNLEAGGDLVNYYGLEQGKAVLTGNAWAVKDNNTLRSKVLTIYLNQNGQAEVAEGETGATE